MKKKNLVVLSAVTAAFLTFSGCGGGGSSSSTNSNNQPTNQPSSTPATTNVQAIDGYVVGATIKALNDSNCQATTGKDGKATLQCEPHGLVSTGGKIDINNNGRADANEPAAPDMSAPDGYTTVTPLTTLAATGKITADKLKVVLGIDEIDADPYATNNVELAKAYNIVSIALLAGAADDLAQKLAVQQIGGGSEQNQSSEVNATSDLLPNFGINLDILVSAVKAVIAEKNLPNADEISAYIDNIANESITNASDIDQVVATKPSLTTSNTPNNAQENNATTQPSSNTTSTATQENNATTQPSGETNNTTNSTTSNTTPPLLPAL